MLANTTGTSKQDENNKSGNSQISPPSISLPKGGGAIRGIGEKFAANPVAGTGSMTVPIATSPGRSGFGPQLSLSYDSGAGNGPVGFGWNLALPSITRKTDKGLPQYRDAEESDVYVLSGAEDLVPVLKQEGRRFEDDTTAPGYTIHRYRPRIEGLFARIERWTDDATGEIHWRSISRDNITTLYGKTAESRVADPSDPQHVFNWLTCESYDDKGNAIVYEYMPEDDANIDQTQPNEHKRLRTANHYLKRIKYGNLPSRLTQPDLAAAQWMFEVVFDYDEGHYEELNLDPTKPNAEQHQLVSASATAGRTWTVRPDPFSSHRAGFEVRTYRRCRRVLMFHRFAELGDQLYLVRATEFEYADLDYTEPITIEAELAYHGSTRFASFIRAVSQSGFVRDDTQPPVERNGATYLTYVKKSLPPVEFEYSKATIQNDIRELDSVSLGNLPIGLDGTIYQWVDLDGEGVSGILTEQADAWFYKPNLGDGHFGPLQVVAAKPSLANLRSGRQQLLDLSGDGQLDLVTLAGPAPGFYERTTDENWEPFRAFTSVPNVRWDDPNLRFVDLNGDGHADVLITEHDVFTWYPSLAEEGFGPARRVYPSLDEESGPKLVLADGTQSIYLADMCGDGLTDLVRIRNGEVCYWPNLGYGRFAPKVTMDNAPWFDNPDIFDQRRIRLADIDGSGTNDIIYLGREGVRLYFNQSGNRLSEPRQLRPLPHIDDLSDIIAVDLLGNGTACLVWSSPLPADARRPMRYIDLMGGTKPHLLIVSKNNLGAETRVRYVPSTQFYVADKAAGTPWVTRIPFPVHVVERVDTYDWISRNRFVTRYAYHHGYFDGVEREFRGFGLVEQWDTEAFATLSASDAFPTGDNVDAATHVPPVLTRTWFHTGAFLDNRRISRQFEHEYYYEGDSSQEIAGLNDDQRQAMLLPDTELPTTLRRPGQAPIPWNLSPDEIRQACRALKGSILRREIYAYDGSEAADRPYTVSERNYTIELLQPLRGEQRSVDRDFAVFFVHPRETIDFHYERKLYAVGANMLADPRVSHQITLAVDDYGNVLQSVAIGYGRRHNDPDPVLTPDDRAKQKRTHLIYTENRYTNAVDQPDDYRTPLPSETLTWEVLGLTPDSHEPKVTNLFRFDEIAQKIQMVGLGRNDLPYEPWDAGEGELDAPARRLIEHLRTLYRADDLAGALPLGALESLALPFESYKLAITPELVAQMYGERVTDTMLENDGRYVHSEGSAGWWIPSGRIFYSPALDDAPADELGHARRHFFLPNRFRDLFEQTTTIAYDAYDLLMQESRDPLGNIVSVGERGQQGTLAVQGNDYRVLQPRLLMDANRNRAAVAFDALSMVVGTALMGKPEEHLGDSLDGFAADLTEAEILRHLAEPLAEPQALLQHATTRLVYDLFAYRRTQASTNPQPAVSYTLARETHAADLAEGQQSKIQHSLAYSDGFGREIQKKIQAEPGSLDAGGPDINPRWVGSGWTIFNNKGKPVRQYEPFFSATHQFEFARIAGVSPVLFYDPAERVVATLHPNHTWEKVVFDPWHQVTWDVNDTVLLDPRADTDIGGFTGSYFEAQATAWRSWYEQRAGGALGAHEQAAAAKTAAHAGTPTAAYFDTLGRPFLTVADNGRDAEGRPQLFATRLRLDIEGNQREVINALGRIVMRYDYDMLGNRMHQSSMEAGQRWMLNDVTGKLIYNWDSRDHRFRTSYDALRRPLDAFLSTGDGPEQLIGRSVYGETQADPEANSLRGKIVQIYDQAGVVTSDAYDFKGNLLNSRNQLAVEYKATLDWSGAVPLEIQVYSSRTSYDALNRPVELTGPDNSVIRPSYNEANFLERVEAHLRGAAEATLFVADIDYDAKGQRTLIAYGNGVRTTYAYDPQTFRLAQIQTLRGAERLQDLSYTYDPAGNITHIRDDAQQTIYFRNRRVDPSAEYTYDAIYRLIAATGREHLGQIGGAPTPTTHDDTPRTGLIHPGDGNAMGTYVERYLYDAVGNLLELRHRGSDPAHAGWTRRYTYAEASLIEPEHASNRLSRSTVGSADPVVERYTYDAHGNITSMPHLPLMRWDYRDQLQATTRQAVNDGTPATTWYIYNAVGQRVRKISEDYAARGTEPRRSHERIYLGDFEIYREYSGDGQTVTLERETLHLMDDQQCVAKIETRTIGEDQAPAQLTRYQLGNHRGCGVIELDDQARIISYEEYYPYGSTSYQAVRSRTETPKRYRFTGKERDEENGLYYHGARYYAPWLGRWTAADPAGMVDGLNAYSYVRNNPMRYTDSTGAQCDPTNACCIDPTMQSSDDQAFTSSSDSSSSSSSLSSGSLSLAATLLRGATPSAAQVEGQQVLVGTSRSQMRSAAEAIIRNDPNHPLRFLLGENGKFKPTRGLSHAELMDAPDLVQMGHIGSNKLGETERLMLQDAWENQFNNLTIEHTRVGGAVVNQRAVDIGGIAVSERTAQSYELAWEYSGGNLGLPPGTTARAPVIPEVPMSSGARLFAGASGVFNFGGGALMFASVDPEHDPALVTAGKITSGGASVVGGGMEVTGALLGEAGLVEVGAAASGVGFIIAVPIMAYEMRPRGWIAYDPELRDRAIQRYRNGENVNAFCAQCHGPGGALDPNNDWNSRDPARRAAFARRLQWVYLGD